MEDAARLLLRGQQNRHTSSTNMNRESSRSHSVFTCVVESKAVDEAGLATMLSARVNLVDLAGDACCKLLPPFFWCPLQNLLRLTFCLISASHMFSAEMFGTCGRFGIPDITNTCCKTSQLTQSPAGILMKGHVPARLRVTVYHGET